MNQNNIISFPCFGTETKKDSHKIMKEKKLFWTPTVIINQPNTEIVYRRLIFLCWDSSTSVLQGGKVTNLNLNFTVFKIRA